MKKHFLLFILSATFAITSHGQAWFGIGVGGTVGHTFLQETLPIGGSRTEIFMPIEVSKTGMFDISLRRSTLGYIDLKYLSDFEVSLIEFQAVEASFVYKAFFGGRRAKTRPFVGGGAKLGFFQEGSVTIYDDSNMGTGTIVELNEFNEGWESVNRVRYGLVGEAGLAFRTGKRSMIQLGLVYDFEAAQVFKTDSGVAPEDNSFLGNLGTLCRLAIKL